jgi:fucose 4-O-acetylase-like acetyltransferase
VSFSVRGVAVGASRLFSAPPFALAELISASTCAEYGGTIKTHSAKSKKYRFRNVFMLILCFLIPFVPCALVQRQRGKHAETRIESAVHSALSSRARNWLSDTSLRAEILAIVALSIILD